MDISSLISSVANAVKTLAPLVETAVDIVDPAAAAIVNAAGDILVGVAKGEPNAVAVFDKIKSGAPYTDEEIAADMAEYDADYQKAVVEAEAKGATLEG